MSNTHQTIQLELPEQFKSDIDYIKAELMELKSKFEPKKPTTYVTRRYVADEMLHCNVSTVHNLVKKGVLIKYAIEGKVLFKREEVENAIVKLNK